ncbi:MULTISPECIES: hypothetical protein [Apibacter]|nr:MULTISPECIES: hypothetical protein [Apibacter]QYN51762.1 hypothetical protein GYM72_09600 [Apibacter sp. ESL0404]
MDKKEAEKILKVYFYNLAYESVTSNDSLYSIDFYTKISKDKLHKIHNSLKNKLGNLIDYKLDKWETRVVSGTQSYSEYGFVYTVIYEKDSATEIFKLKKDDKGRIKIYYHDISSLALLND